MPTVLTSTALTACVIFVCLVPVLSGCGGMGGASFETSLDNNALPLRRASPPPSGPDLAAAGLAVVPHGSAAHGGEPVPSGSPAVTVVTTPTASRTVPEPRHSAGQPDVLPDTVASDVSAASEDPSPSSAAAAVGTTLDSRRLATRPRDNPAAADLLDHWGHRHSHRIADGLSLAVPATGDNATDLQTLRTAVQARGKAAGSGPLRR